MTGLRALTATWHRRAPATVRTRLTAVYGGLFLGLGIVLLSITYGLFARQLRGDPPAAPPAPSAPPGRRPPGLPDNADAFRERLEDALAQQRADALRELLTQSAVALAIVSVIAVALGWLVAGRVLRPLRDITATARRLSSDNLDERISLPGPRDELRELADTFDAMLGRLSAAFESQRRFVANASHELRTPLTVQQAAVDVALADPDPTVESLRTMADRIRRSTRQHEHLIASLLTLARSERGADRADRLDLAEVARHTLTAASAGIEARGLTVTADLGPAPMRGDAVLLHRLVANLIENALRHNIRGGWLDVRTDANGDIVRLRVSNSGATVAADQVAALFEPFRRGAPDRTTDRQGHGLGLSIVAAITTAHQGNCFARAGGAGGLEIAVELPAEPPTATR